MCNDRQPAGATAVGSRRVTTALPAAITWPSSGSDPCYSELAWKRGFSLRSPSAFLSETTGRTLTASALAALPAAETLGV